MATSLTTSQAVEARRTQLFRLGADATEAMWDEVAQAQRALDDQAFGPDGYVRHDYHR